MRQRKLGKVPLQPYLLQKAMSEYQYYRFECLDGHLSSSQRQALRQISSRADISTASFQVSYHYSDLKAELQQMMLDNFDIGVYFASWGAQVAYIKLPQGTLPAELLQFRAYGFSVYDTDQWQLLVFSNEESERYLDDEDAEELLQHLANLRGELLQGDWRLVYFIWLRAFDIDAEPDAIPLINFDFQQLSVAQRAFVDLFDVPLAVVKALALTLANAPSHSANPAQLQLDKWLEQLTEIEKDQLLQVVFTEGQLTKHAAVAMTRKPAESEHYQYWLDSAIITPYIDTAATQLAQQ
ncbi:hypothetical protein L9G15_13695 [Shewanella sp. A3A]|nr:hypothetical protein [Shewanella ferrihydritica]